MNLLDAIENRHAYNGFHTDEPVTEEEMNILLKAFNKAPSQFNSQPWKVLISRDKENRYKLAEYCGIAMKTAMEKGEFWEKYGKYFYHDKNGSSIKPGMGMKVDHIPNFLKQIINFIISSDAMSFIREKSIPTILGIENRKLVEKSPVCLAIFLRKADYNKSDNSSFYSTLSLGMAIENMWLAATEMNIGMQFMSMPMEVPEIWKKISDMYNCPTEFEMVALMRLGHMPEKPDRPVLDWTSPDRLPLQEWTLDEKFGSN
ncbi:MAG: nitroreductase family protein [Leptospiraceae bacterium]|nr:nitroreductase family protein [Leptospiraceae bacterium]MCP5513193.1 nitroreductase family protein [Leptospiraceae bacterium]